MNPVSYDSSRSSILYFLKLGILLFWACWFGLACASNYLDFMYALGDISPDWHFRSGNYELLHGVLNIYDMSTSFLNTIFICDITVQGLSALLFLTAAVCYMGRWRPWRFINAAFALSMALWAVFIIMEEVFIAYRFEGVHVGLFMFELIALMALHSLP